MLNRSIQKRKAYTNADTKYDIIFKTLNIQNTRYTRQKYLNNTFAALKL